jgi:mRNA interferase HicA
MKREKVFKYLKKYDCEIFREGKKHTIVINKNNNKITAIPRHSDIKDKLLLSICKDLGIPQIQSH